MKKITWERVRFYFAKYWELIVVILAALFIFQMMNSYENKVSDLTLRNQVLGNEMTSYRNRDSLHVAKIVAIETDNYKSFLKIQSKDSMILFLQSEVKKYKKQIKEPGSSITTVTNTTHMQGTIPTNVTQSPLAAGVSSTFPTYTSSKSTLWLDLNIIAKRDSTHFDLKVRNKYSVVVGHDKQGTFAEVTNYNPYTETTDMRTYSVLIPKPKRLSLGIHAGYGIVDTGFGPYFGVGINYDLINLK